MGNSLQDQLLKLGLVDDKRVKQTKQEKHKEVKQQRSRKADGVDPGKLQAQREQAEKAERDRQLNLQRKAEADRRALLAQIKQMIETNRLPKRDGDIAYNFVDGTKVKRLYVTETVQQQLGNGQAAIVKLHGQYDIVPFDIAEKIAQRDSACVIWRGGADQQQPPPPPKDDDPYAEFQVPDDLIW